MKQTVKKPMYIIGMLSWVFLTITSETQVELILNICITVAYGHCLAWMASLESVRAENESKSKVKIKK